MGVRSSDVRSFTFMDTLHQLSEEPTLLYRYEDGFKWLPYFWLHNRLFLPTFLYLLVETKPCSLLLHTVLNKGFQPASFPEWLSFTKQRCGPFECSGVSSDDIWFMQINSYHLSNTNSEASIGKRLIYADDLRLPMFLCNCVKNTQTHTMSKLYQEKLLPSARLREPLC